MEWINIKNDDDIKELKYEFFNFHDACIVSANYVSGAFVDKNNQGHFNVQNNDLVVTFQNPTSFDICGSDRRTLELRFSQVLNFSLSGTKNGKFFPLLECYLGFIDGYIVWSDNGDFDYEPSVDNLLKNGYSVIAAKQLCYRFLDE